MKYFNFALQPLGCIIDALHTTIAQSVQYTLCLISTCLYKQRFVVLALSNSTGNDDYLDWIK